MAYVKLRLRDHFLQEWNSNLENSPIYWYLAKLSVADG